MDLSKLKAPFPKERVSWRAQVVTKDGTKAMALGYIDARDVMERLDEVCGPENWQCRYSHADKKTVCEIGIRVGNEWVWKADGAGDSDIEAEKGALSDAFKRCAVRWQIGRYLYDLETPWVPCKAYQKGDRWVFQEFTDDPWKHVRSAPKAESPKAEPPKESTPERADAWIAKAKEHARKFTNSHEVALWMEKDGYKLAISTMQKDYPEKATAFTDWITELKESLPVKEAA